MEIEYKNKNYKRKSIYQVGNVIMHVGQPYLVTRIFFNDGHEKYFFVNLKNGNLHTEPYDSLEELPKNVYQKLDLIMYDINGNKYSEDDEFQEKKFRNLFINYKTSMVEISSDKYNIFDIHTSILIEQEDLAVIGKVISIVVKHLSKIEFEESY